MIKIIDVDKNNFWDVTKLRVGDMQKDFIESNAQSIAESKYYDGWKPVCIYNDDMLIGFAMYGKCSEDVEKNRVWFDRFMIDSKFQGRGYGKQSLDVLIRHIEKLYNTSEIYLSIFEENILALEMYKNLGFNFNGEMDYGGERVMVLHLN